MKPKRPTFDREIFEVLHKCKDLSTSQLTAKTYLCRSTVHNIRKGPKNGGTRFPRSSTVDELMRAAGFRKQWVPISNSSRKDLLK
jgi:glutamate dehydrogenase/leucine dehydrogenase